MKDLQQETGDRDQEKQGVAFARSAVVYRRSLEEEERRGRNGACIHPRRHAGCRAARHRRGEEVQSEGRCNKNKSGAMDDETTAQSGVLSVSRDRVMAGKLLCSVMIYSAGSDGRAVVVMRWQAGRQAGA